MLLRVVWHCPNGGSSCVEYRRVCADVFFQLLWDLPVVLAHDLHFWWANVLVNQASAVKELVAVCAESQIFYFPGNSHFSEQR